MRQVVILLALLVSLCVPALAQATPTLKICTAENSAGTCTGSWLTEAGQTDFCGATYMSDLNHVWVDDSNGQSWQQNVVNCEVALSRPKDYIYAGDAAQCYYKVTGATNFCEWYPYWDCDYKSWGCIFSGTDYTDGTGEPIGEPSDTTPPGDVESQQGPLSCASWNDFITQWAFGWPSGVFNNVDNPPPNQGQADHIWWQAIGCVPSGQTRPEGIY